MNAHENWNREEVWQSVVDGELSVDQLRELVRACESQPELWKRCAVAFLEEQTLQRELKALAWPGSNQEAPKMQVDQLFEGSIPSTVIGSARIQDSNAKPAGLAILLNNLALAATILLAFVIGWQTSRRLEFGRNSTGDASLAGVGTEKIASPAVTNLASTAADAIESALDRPEDVVPFDRTIPKELEELVRLGVVDVKSTDGFVPVRLNDGNAAIVPFHRYQVQPVRQTKAY